VKYCMLALPIILAKMVSLISFYYFSMNLSEYPKALIVEVPEILSYK